MVIYGYPMTEMHHTIPNDTRTTYAVRYERNDTTVVCTYIFSDDVIKENQVYKTFMVLMRKDFKNIGDDEREQKFIYTRFGLNAEDPISGETLEDSLEQDDLKDAWLTYATSRDNEDFSWLVDKYYSEQIVEQDPYGDWKRQLVGNPNDITIDGEVSFSYSPGSTMEDSGTTGYLLYYSGGHFPCDTKEDDEDEFRPMYVIPLNDLLHLSMRMKFEAYNDVFSMWAYSEKTVKLKWYQTGFFRFIMMILGAFLAFMSGGVLGVMMYLGLQFLNVLLANIDPQLAMILGTVLAVVTLNFNFSSLASAFQTLNKMLQIVMNFNKIMFANSVEQIQSLIEDITEETKDMKDEIKDILHNTIYIPFGDKIEMGYNKLFDLPYMQNELLDDSISLKQYEPKYFR